MALVRLDNLSSNARVYANLIHLFNAKRGTNYAGATPLNNMDQLRAGIKAGSPVVIKLGGLSLVHI